MGGISWAGSSVGSCVRSGAGSGAGSGVGGASPGNQRLRRARATLTSAIITGTSMRGPITAAKATAEPMPKTAIATAIASSKLLLAAVNASVVVTAPPAPARRPIQKLSRNMITKYSANGRAMRSTSSGMVRMSPPLRLNITTIVNRRATNVMGPMAGRKRRSYQSCPFRGSRTTRLSAPAANGRPR